MTTAVAVGALCAVLLAGCGRHREGGSGDGSSGPGGGASTPAGTVQAPTQPKAGATSPAADLNGLLDELDKQLNADGGAQPDED